MRAIMKKLAVSSSAALGAVVLMGAPAYAHGSERHMYQANLNALNGSGASGTAMVEEVDENTVKVTLNVTGTSANLPHAQHIHVGGNNTCPTPSADKDNDKLINTVEGQPAYGEIKVSLTTTGDVSKDSGLAVDRFPVANADGTVSYSRTFDLPSGVTSQDIANGVIVHHGISELFNDKAKYDGDKKSPLNKDLPLEATIPAACGKLTAAPVGGVGAGSGSTAGLENVGFALAGGLAIAASAVLLSRRSVNWTR